MRFKKSLGLAAVLSGGLSCCAAQADGHFERFLDELPTQIVEYAQHVENCIVPDDFTDFCSIVEQTLGEFPESGTPKGHHDVAYFLVATLTNVFTTGSERAEIGKDLNCNEVENSGALITPLIVVDGEIMTIRRSGSSCYLDMLESNNGM